MKLAYFIILFAFCIDHYRCSENDDEYIAGSIVDDICEELKYREHKVTLARWNYVTNLTEVNKDMDVKEQEIYAAYLKYVAKNLSVFDYKNFKNETLKRLIKFLTNIGDAKLSEQDFSDKTNSLLRMQNNLGKAKIPSFNDNSKLVSLDPEISETFRKSRNPEELKYYWIKWFDAAGKPSKNDFFKYVELRNKAAKLNGFKDGADYWIQDYEDPTFEDQIDDIMEQIKPLYMQLHGYVRHKLSEHYGPDLIDISKPMPIHLLGNIWAQQWFIDDLVSPYDIENTDVDSEFVKHNYTALRMFQDSESFFKSIGLSPMTASFWEKSIIEKPTDGREFLCHPTAWDFAINNDFRIKQCTRLTSDSYETVHHEMGHIEYFLQYSHLPVPFRAGANPGFHEAVGDTIALSVRTQKHLHTLGLLKEINNDPRSQINELFKKCLEKIVFLPYAYAFDKFRYEVFRGFVKPENANEYFWYLREKFGGVVPPVQRTNEDFDITVKYHASADVEYMRYFVSFILQFQFHKAACIKANQYEVNNPEKTLADCDIYQSKEAGSALKKMLSLGSSVPWNDALEVMTGERKLDASALLEYFDPLYKWLINENKKLNVHVGW